jgi:hypothetical protein
MNEGCPLVGNGQFSDKHHLAYPAYEYRTGIEKKWRELSFNKANICRCIHDAIHSSGYVPPKPSRDEMLSEIWSQEPTERSQDELSKQLFLGGLALERGEIPDDAA